MLLPGTYVAGVSGSGIGDVLLIEEGREVVKDEVVVAGEERATASTEYGSNI